MKKTGVAVLTYNRPDFCKQSLEYVKKLKNVDYRALHDDGSDKADYTEVFDTYSKDFHLIKTKQNGGVAKAKNRVVKYLLDKGCDYIFLVEDDILVKNPDTLNKYIETYEKTGINHFNFHAHGPGNPSPVNRGELVTMWPNCVGAFSFYTRKCFEKAGLFDEHFINAWEHVEHTARLARLGLTSPFWYFADVTGSEAWIKEIKGSIENSSIRHSPEWTKNMEEGLRYWKLKDGIGLPEKNL
jgi:GT2 family glycosyltransferase